MPLQTAKVKNWLEK